MPGKSFQSKLEPYFDFILEARRNHQTWEAIVQLLAAQGITTTKQAIHAFIKRRLRRRYPLGASPASKNEPVIPPQDLSQLTELLPPPSDFGPDPLTMSSKDRWGVSRPNKS